MNPKGFAITIMVLLLGLAILQLSSSASKRGMEQSQELELVSATERVAYKYENITENILELVQLVAGTMCDGNGTVMSCSERIPDKSKKDSLDSTVAVFDQFMLLFPDGLDVNIASELIELTELNIGPYDINYSHSTTKARGNRKNDTVYFKPSSVNFAGYIVDITLHNQAYESISSSFRACTGGCSTPIYFVLRVYNSSKVLQTSVSNSNIDPNDESTVTIDTSGVSNNDIEITIGPDSGNLTIVNNNSVAVDLNTTVDFGAGAPEPPFIDLPPGLVTVSSRAHGVAKE